eukprot:COSAG02_NODE_325_length_24616_cov_17.214667_16_plen_2024_part_01
MSVWLFADAVSDWIPVDKIQQGAVPCDLTLTEDSIDATSTGLSAGEMHVLAAWIKRSTTQIQTLTLAGNLLSGAQREESESGVTWSAVDTALSGMKALCSALNDASDSVGITHLDLASCGLGAQSTLLLAKSLATDGHFKRSAERIILDGNYVTDSRFRVHSRDNDGATELSWKLDQDVSALQMLGKSLQYASNLVVLSLVDCHIGPAALVAFADAVAWSSIALKSLELGGNPLSSELIHRSDGPVDVSATSRLCAQLGCSTQLEFIGLDRIGGGPELLLDLTEAMRKLPALKKVNLSGNLIGTAYTRPIEDVDVHVPVQHGCVAAYQHRFGEVMRDPDADGEVQLRWLNNSALSDWINHSDLSPVVDSLSHIVRDYSHIKAFAAAIHSLEEVDISYCAFDRHAVDCLVNTVRWTDATFNLKDMDFDGNNSGEDARGQLEATCKNHSVQVGVGQGALEMQELADKESRAAEAYRNAAKAEEDAQTSIQTANEAAAAAKERGKDAALRQDSDEAKAAEIERKAAEAVAATQQAETSKLAAAREAAELQNRIAQQQLADAQLNAAQQKVKPRHFHRVSKSDQAQLAVAEEAFAKASTILDDEDRFTYEQRAVDEAKEALKQAKSSRGRRQAEQALEQCEYKLEMAKKDILAKELYRLADQQEATAARAVRALRSQEEIDATKESVAQSLAADRAEANAAQQDLTEAQELLQKAKIEQEAALQARIEANRQGMKGLVLARQARKAREQERLKQLATTNVVYNDEAEDDLRVNCGVDCLTGAVSTEARRRLTLFSVLLILCGSVGLLCMLQIFDIRVRGAQQSGLFAYITHFLAIGAVITPIAGIYGAMQHIEPLLRGCSFALYVLTCSYLGISASLVHESRVQDGAMNVLILASVAAMLSATCAYSALRIFCAWTFRRDDNAIKKGSPSTWMDHPKAKIRRVNHVLFVSGWFGWFKATHLGVVCLLLYNLAIESPTSNPAEFELFPRMMLEFFVCFFTTSGSLIDVLMVPGNRHLCWCFQDAVTALDSLCVVTSWFSFAWPQYGRFFSLVRCLRVVRPMVALAELEFLLDEVHAATLIGMAFTAHASLYQTVVLFVAFSLLCSCIIAVNLFGGAIQYSCEAISTVTNTTGYMCPSSLSGPRWWGIPPCSQESECYRLDPPRELLGGDDTGERGFNSVPQAFVTLLAHISCDGGINDLPTAVREAGARGSEFAWMFFAVLIVILQWVVFTMLLGMGVYTIGEAEQTVKDHARDSKQIEPTNSRKAKASLGSFGTKESLVNFDKQRRQLATSIEELNWDGSTCCNLQVGQTRNKIKMFAISNTFRTIVLVMVLLWTGVLLSKTGRESATSAGDVDNWSSVRQLLELLLLVGFISEIVVKVIGFGVRRFFISFENVLDLVVFIVTCAGWTISYFGYLREIYCEDDAATIALEMYSSMPDENDTLQELNLEATKARCVEKAISESTLKFFRVMRIVQVTRILYKQEDVNDVMIKAFSNWQLVFGVFAAVAFLVICFSVIGMQLLAGSGGCLPYTVPLPACVYSIPRSNFESFTNALTSTVQIVLNDGWKSTLMFYWGQNSFTPAVFVVSFFVCRGILFNLMRAMMLVNFALDEDLKIPKQMEKYWRARTKLEDSGTVRKPIEIALAREVAETAQMEETAEEIVEDLVQLLRRYPGNSIGERSLWLFRPNGHIRVAAAAIETSPIFIGLQVLIISTSCVWMAVKDEQGFIEQLQYEQLQLLAPMIDQYVEYAVLGMFASEAIVKTISSGFLFKSGPSEPYLQVAHNVWDFVILVALVLIQLEGFRAYCRTKGIEENHLQIFAGLGPVVGLMQVGRVRREVNAFSKTLPEVATVGVPLLFIILGFSLAGIELFANLMKQCHCPPAASSNATLGSEIVTSWQYCQDGMAMNCNTTDMNDPCNKHPVLQREILSRADCVIRQTHERDSVDNRAFLWQNTLLAGSFDDSMEGAKALIKASTSSSTALLYALMDSATVKDAAPTINNSALSASAFLLVYHAIVTVFLLNLFFAVMGK